ncbi:uncharacterized protein BXZ73DRAFT_102738 [Epithele typhae]|uniref:uncharacterized protein n=1 Tax=Epithele typhae TaxID=378194 RepID=UPI0020079597|nr:uncharacterized protein BXZ73DRAFT_102738 [Epithele typhae]KAH9927149.1 hypothetical protein BXZ73DRAFT_102738 [Epithele typhae]
MPSPEVIESSQSQFETEITASVVEGLATRNAALIQSGTVSSGSSAKLPQSTPPPETQCYDAHDEMSSQDVSSQASSFSVSVARTLPLVMPSQLPPSMADSTQSSFGDHSVVRRFLEVFDGRDGDGNDFSGSYATSSSESIPPAVKDFYDMFSQSQDISEPTLSQILGED